MNWSMAFLITMFYGPISNAVGTALTFWGFSVCLVFVFIYCLFFVPETKGKSKKEAVSRLS